MKLPASLPRRAAAVAAPALRAADLDDLARDAWHAARNPHGMRDLGAARAYYSAVRAKADGIEKPWVCAIDPVRFSADMRDVRLSAWPLDDFDATAADALHASVAELLASDGDPRLRRLELVMASPARWYLVGEHDDALVFHVAPADSLLGHALRSHKPVGDDGRLVQRLTTELQMLCHAQGAAVSGFWLSAPGGLPELKPQSLPALSSDDPFWRGCWSLLAPDAVVANGPLDEVVPVGHVVAADPGSTLRIIHSALSNPELRRLTVIAGDATVTLVRGGWRRLFGGRGS
ncbi:MAG: hypothetical protein AAF574_12845 [Pseudomonadota bacterium]